MALAPSLSGHEHPSVMKTPAKALRIVWFQLAILAFNCSALPPRSFGEELAAPRLEFVVAGSPVSLPPEVAKQIISQIEAIVETSNFNSKDHPQFFPEQRNVGTGPSFLRVDYPAARKFKTVGGDLVATRVEVALGQRGLSGLPGPFTLVDGDRRIELSKESGVLCVRLGRLPGFHEHLPAPMREGLARSPVTP